MPIVPPESAEIPAKRSIGEELNRRLGWALPALAALAFAVFRLPELTRSSLWYEEIRALGLAELPVADALRRLLAEHATPPLFPLLLKGWVSVGGDSDHWVRLLPCLFSMMLGAALVWLAREVRVDTRATLLGVALGAASTLSVDFATEVAPYSLLSLLSCLSLAAALHDRTHRTRESLALLTLLNVALVHTHYLGWLTVAAELVTAVAFWTRDEARRMARSALFTVLAFAPWAFAVLATGSDGAANPSAPWVVAPDAWEPLRLLRDLTARTGVAAADLGWLAFVGVALLALAAGAVRRRGAERAPTHAPAAPTPAVPRESLAETLAAVKPGALALLALSGFLAPLGLFAAALTGAQGLWAPPGLLGAAGPVALLTAVAISALPPRKLNVAAVAGFIWVGVACAVLPQRSPNKFDWRRLVRRMDLASAGATRDVVALEQFTAAPLTRYASAGMRVGVVRSLYQLPAGEFWLVYRRESFATGTAAERLRGLGFRTLTTLSAEAAGQRVSAVRVARP